MSFFDILEPPTKPWADIYVNSINLPGTTGATGLNTYVETPVSLGFTGAFVGVTGVFNVTQVGNIIQMNVPAMTATATAGTYLSALTPLPSAFIPATAKYFVALVNVNGASTAGLIFIPTNGVITIFATPAQGSFTSGDTAGTYPQSISYNLN